MGSLRAGGSGAASAGAIGDSGGEQITAKINPWRVGPVATEFCVERAADFPAAKSELSALVAESFSDWVAFFAQNRMNGPFPEHGTPAQESR